MKTPDYLILVSTRTTKETEVTRSTIIEQHTSLRAHGGFGFNRPGFDYLVQPGGELETILDESHQDETDLWGIGDGINGLMGTATYLAYAGGMNEKLEATDTRTEEQNDTLAVVVHFYVRRFPDLRVLGWDQLPGRQESQNPGFDVSYWLQAIGIPKLNQYSNR